MHLKHSKLYKDVQVQFVKTDVFGFKQNYFKKVGEKKHNFILMLLLLKPEFNLSSDLNQYKKKFL